MAFNSNDSYALSGGVSIYNYWNPFVTKHDTSSFYNWEQDNLPLYDLEERTYYLWEKFGYPLSGVPSMALLVSSTIPDSFLSSNVFTTVSGAIEALPEIIRMPTMIEVALSGNMGSLELDNIKCVEDGLLEIVNRGFAPLNEWSEVSGTGATTANVSVYMNDLNDPNNYIPNQFSAVGPLNYIKDSSAVAFSSTLARDTNNRLFPATGKKGFWRHLAYASTQSSSVAANRVPSKSGYGFAGVGNYGTNDILINVSANMMMFRPIAGTTFPGSKGPQDNTIDSKDVSTYNDVDAAFMTRAAPVDGYQLLNGITTANRLDHIKLQNCDGPIYIRGFAVDGYDDEGSIYDTSVGIGVYNSAGISIEDCGAMRCTSAGYEIENSKVMLRRRNLAMRNYNKLTRGTKGYDTYGFKISNSDVEYKVDPAYSTGTAACLTSHFHTYGIHLSNSKLHGGEIQASLGTGPVSLTNSRTLTPVTVGYNEYGLYADSSEYDIEGMSDIYNNEYNIKANGSEIRTGRFQIDFANREGLDFSNSRFILNTKYNEALRSRGNSIFNSSDFAPYNRLGMFNKNRRHISLHNGSYYGPDYPTDTSSYVSGVGSLGNAYSMIEYNFSFGKDGTESTDAGWTSPNSFIPSIYIDNSRAVMPATTLRNSSNAANTTFVKGAAIQANNGGVCKLIGYGAADTAVGSEIGRTFIMGGASYLGQQRSSGLAALNNSIIYITGPTGIAQYGVGILADNNSIIKACPVLAEDDSSYDGSGWGRMALNVGTSLDIHATRTCAVASNKSQLRFEDLGYYRNFWPDSVVAATDYQPFGLSVSGVLSSTLQSGALQFYPNPVNGEMAMATLGTTNFNSISTPIADPVAFAYDTSLSCNRVLYKNSYGIDHADQAEDYRDDATRGGVCVRATGGSEVFVRNVHFPTGFYNGDKSFFDPSASIAGCNDLQIWNIQDTSRLDASYATVSGVYPSLAGYTGPRSYYTSGVVVTGVQDETKGDSQSSAVAYACFSGTPDTGMLSVLDHFGSGIQVSAAIAGTTDQVLSKTMQLIQQARTGSGTTYGEDSYQNRGPFRLFFPINPAARALSYLGTSAGDTVPYQHLAQGYNLSGTVSANPELSSLYPDLLNSITPGLVFGELPPAIVDTSKYWNSGGKLAGGTSTPEAIAMSGWYFHTEVPMYAVSSADFSGAPYVTKSMLPDSDPTNIMLDESFSNTFNNAKHCSTSYSGRKKLVTIYKATTSGTGESFPGVDGAYAIGLGNGFTSTNIFDVERDM